MREQLRAEASRRGLGRANEVLLIADGAVWIWNLAADRFPQARQRVDYYHVSAHLWTVGRGLIDPCCLPDGNDFGRRKAVL